MKDIFSKYLQSKMSLSEFEQFSDFISKEENTQLVYDMMTQEWEESSPNVEESTNLNSQTFQRIIYQIFQDENVQTKRKAKIYLIGLRIAAILIIGLVFSSVWFYLQSDKNSLSGQIQTVSIPYGAKTKLTMPDGSTVWLNSGSTLNYSSDFSKKREVMLSGEAFFEVQKDKIPFEVNTNFGKIKVLGTGFNVLADPASGFVTTLVHGSVEIDGTNYKQSQILEPGQQSKLIGNTLVKSNVETDLFTSWKDGKMIFKREPFGNLMTRLERWFNVKIEYTPEDFKDLWYSGTIENETITEVMEMVGTAAPVQFNFNSKTRIIQVNLKNKLNNTK